MSSSLAEGYHRSARLEKLRAPPSSMPWLLSTMRLKENMALAEEWCSTPEGRRSFSFDYLCYTRILQPPKRQWKRCKCGKKKVFATVYHLKDQARIDWEFVESDDEEREAEPENKEELSLLRTFLLYALEHGKVYSLVRVDTEAEIFFQILAKDTASWCAQRGGAEPRGY